MSILMHRPAKKPRDDKPVDAGMRERLSVAARRATIANCALVLVALVLMCVVSEQWWFSAALCYLPRSPLLVPSILLLAVTLLTDCLLAGANALCGAIVLGPIMGLTAPLSGMPSPPDEQPQSTLRIVSCNVQNGSSELGQVLAELEQLNADVIALQETKWGCELLEEYFAGWHTIHHGEYWISSRFPMRLISVCAPEAFERESAIVCEVATPAGTFTICDVHLTTARHGLTDLHWHSVISQKGVRDFEWYQWQRQVESGATREFLNAAAEHPVVALGDFNTPVGSSLFVPIWGKDMTSAFDAAGWGYGYTAPCNTRRLWPENTPWVRIDHILCDGNWSIHACGIGASAGSDHRLIWADVSLDFDPESASAIEAERDHRQVVGL